jgi:hypothetical protein
LFLFCCGCFTVVLLPLGSVDSSGFFSSGTFSSLKVDQPTETSTCTPPLLFSHTRASIRLSFFARSVHCMYVKIGGGGVSKVITRTGWIHCKQPKEDYFVRWRVCNCLSFAL